MKRRTRRAVLQAGAGLTAAMAGCSRLDSLTGSSETGTYLDWLPAPEALDRDDYPVNRLGEREYREHVDAIHPATHQLLTPFFVTVGDTVRDAVGEVNGLFSAGPRTAVLQDVPAATPTKALLDAGYEQRDTRRGFDILAWGGENTLRDFRPPWVAVGETNVVVGRLNATRSDLESVVDAREGVVDRYHDRNQRVRTVGSAVGERTFTWLFPARQDDVAAGLTASAYGWDLDGQQTTLTMAMQFEDEADAEVAATRRSFGGQWLSEYRDVSVSRDGAVVDVTGTIATDRFDLTWPGDPGEDGVPNARFDVVADDEMVTATHAGEQPVPADRLRVSFEAFPAAVNDPEPTERQFEDRYEMVEEGDSLTVTADEGGMVFVEWHHAEADATFLLGSANVDPE